MWRTAWTAWWRSATGNATGLDVGAWLVLISKCGAVPTMAGAGTSGHQGARIKGVTA